MIEQKVIRCKVMNEITLSAPVRRSLYSGGYVPYDTQGEKHKRKNLKRYVVIEGEDDPPSPPVEKKEKKDEKINPNPTAVVTPNPAVNIFGMSPEQWKAFEKKFLHQLSSDGKGLLATLQPSGSSEGKSDDVDSPF